MAWKWLVSQSQKTKSAVEDFVSVVAKAFYGTQRTMIKLWSDVEIIFLLNITTCIVSSEIYGFKYYRENMTMLTNYGFWRMVGGLRTS